MGYEYHKFQAFNDQLIQIEKQACSASQIINSWPTYYAEVCNELQMVQGTIANLSVQRQQAQDPAVVDVLDITIAAKRE